MTVANANIVAQAFRFMEVTPPSSLSDGSKKALDAAEQYPVALEICLAAEDFSFARTLFQPQAIDPPAGEIADPELPYTYQRPSGLLRILDIYQSEARWRLDATVIRCEDAAPIYFLGTFTITNETGLPATFRTAVAAQLASLLSPLYAATRAKREELRDQVGIYMQQAIENDLHSASAADYTEYEQSRDWVTEVQW